MLITKSYIDIGKESRPGIKLKSVKAIIMHWTGVPRQTAKAVIGWWDNDANGVYGSAHFVIDIDGDIYNTIPIDEVAYHVGSTNYTDFAKKYFGEKSCTKYDTPNNYSIGIEMIPIDSNGNYSKYTWDSGAELTNKLLVDNNLNINNLFMHSHIRPINEKRCPKLFCDDPAKWEEFKIDVGMK